MDMVIKNGTGSSGLLVWLWDKDQGDIVPITNKKENTPKFA